jgi:small ligand-binding sensory domain FIST
MFIAAQACGPHDALRLADSCVAQIGPGHTARTGFIYATDVLAGEFDAVVDRLRRGTGISTWVGALGMGVAAGDGSVFDAPALSVLAADFPAGATRLLEADGGEPPTGLAAWTAAQGGGVAIVHGDGRDATLVERLGDLAGLAGCFAMGGLASSRVGPCFHAGSAGVGPLSGIVLAPALVAAVGLTQGCHPIGAERHRITQADGGLIETLDHRPALEVLREDLARLPAGRQAAAARSLHAALPIAGRGDGDYLVRHLVGFDPANGTIAIADDAEPGRELLFVGRDRDSAVADLRRMAGRTRAAAPRARGALYFSCVARGPHMFEDPPGELGILREALGDIPLAGLFCDGEIFDARLYGYTGVLALLA